jgi:peptidyl-prolyl cis-trans isomerase C
MHRCLSALPLLLLAVSVYGVAQRVNPDDEVLAQNSSIKLTRADYETDLLRVPPEKRAEFAASPKRLTMMLNNLIVDKTLAKEARDSGLDRDPETARRLALEIDRFLAQAMLGKVERDAAAEFDAKKDQMMVTARETYMVNKDRYMAPEEVSASHILFEPGKHGGSDAALALAKETRAKIVAGADFAKLAGELSDDPSAATNGGQLGWFEAKKMDPAFAKAAFALAKVGDISEPVQSSFGWHIIRLDGRHPPRQLTFDEASKRILADMKQRYVKEKRNAKLEAITHDPQMKVNQAAVDALVVKLPDAPHINELRPQQEPRPQQGK